MTSWNKEDMFLKKGKRQRNLDSYQKKLNVK